MAPQSLCTPTSLQQLPSKGQSGSQRPERWASGPGAPAGPRVPAAVLVDQSGPMSPEKRRKCSGVQKRRGMLTCFQGPFSRCWDGLRPSLGARTDRQLARPGLAPLPRSALPSAISSQLRLDTPTGGPGRSLAPARPPPPTRGGVATPTCAHCPQVMGPPLVEGSRAGGGPPCRPPGMTEAVSPACPAAREP